MSDENKPVVKGEKKKQRKARRALLLLLRKLQKLCGSFNSVNDWYSFLETNLKPILFVYGEVLSEDIKTNLKKAENVLDESSDGLSNVCKTLQVDVQGAIKFLPKTGFFQNLVFGSVIVGAVVIGTGVVLLNRKTVSILIHNQGCGLIQPPVLVGMPVKLPGLQLFNHPIPDGGRAEVKLLPVPITVDTTTKGQFSIGFLGATSPGINLGSDIEFIFDGKSLSNSRQTLNLSETPRHELIVSCEQ